MNLEPWFVFVDGLSATTQSRQMDMPRMDAGASAQDLADAFDGISAGFRVLQNVSFDRFPHDNDPTKTYLVSHHPDDKYNGKSGLWIENGVAEMQQKWTDWFDEFTNTFSGTIDHLYSSDEGWSLWDASEYSNPSGNPLFWLPGYWEDQMDNPKWYTYQFWGKTMAEWLHDLAPTIDFPGDLPAWTSRDLRVAEALYEVAWRWWQRKIVHDTVAPFLPNCTFSDYPRFQMTEENKEVYRAGDYAYLWNIGPLPGNVNDFGLYFDIDPLTVYVDGANFDEPWPWVIFGANIVRAIVRSSWEPVIVHVGGKHWLDPSAHPIYASDYYDEVIIHIILSQGQPNLFYFNDVGPDYKAADELTLNNLMTLTQSQCLSANTIYSIAKEHVAYNSDYLASAVYLNDTHSGVARVTFAPGVDSVTFTLRGLEFPASRDGDELGAWVNFGPILHYDNWSFDQANAFTFDQVNILNFGGTRVMTLDDANALDLDQANALFE